MAGDLDFEETIKLIEEDKDIPVAAKVRNGHGE